MTVDAGFGCMAIDTSGVLNDFIRCTDYKSIICQYPTPIGSKSSLRVFPEICSMRFSQKNFQECIFQKNRGLGLVMGLDQKILTWVVSNFGCSSQIGSTISGLGLALENFTLKSQIFQLFLFRSGQKVPGSKLAWPLIYCSSKLCSGRVRAHL